MNRLFQRHPIKWIVTVEWRVTVNLLLLEWAVNRRQSSQNPRPRNVSTSVTERPVWSLDPLLWRGCSWCALTDKWFDHLYLCLWVLHLHVVFGMAQRVCVWVYVLRFTSTVSSFSETQVCLKDPFCLSDRDKMRARQIWLKMRIIQAFPVDVRVNFVCVLYMFKVIGSFFRWGFWGCFRFGTLGCFQHAPVKWWLISILN